MCSNSVRGEFRSLQHSQPFFLLSYQCYQHYTIAITHSICVCLSQCGDGQGRCEGRSHRQEAATALYVMSRPREGRGTALELEIAIRSWRLSMSTRLLPLDLQTPNVSTVSMDRSGRVQRGWGWGGGWIRQSGGLNFPELVHVVLFYQLIIDYFCSRLP